MSSAVDRPERTLLTPPIADGKVDDIDANRLPERGGSNGGGRQRLWVACDQTASSVTNFGASALAAGLLLADDFGAWAVGFAVAVIVVTATRTWCGDVLMILAGDAHETSRGSAAVSFSLAVGVASGFMLVGASQIRYGSAESALLGIALGLPALLVQDACRYVLLARRRARAAFVNDTLWGVVTLSLLLLLRRADNDSVFLSMLAYSLGAIPSAALGIFQTRSRLSAPGAISWVRRVRPMSSRLITEYSVFMLSSLTSFVVVLGVLGDVGLTGGVRGAQVLLGPLTVVFAATTTYLQPVMSREFVRGESIVRRGQLQSVLLVSITVCWLIVLWITPRSIGTRVFGFTWDGAQSVLWQVGVAVACSAASVGAINILRCSRRLTESMVCHLILGGLAIVGAASGAVIGGSEPALIGFTVAALVGPALLWNAALRAGRPTVTTNA